MQFLLAFGVIVLTWVPAASQSVAAPPAALDPAVQPLLPGCVPSIRDQANPGSCLQASSVPTPGLLFPPPHDGGTYNAAGGQQSFIGGGRNNTTTGDQAVIGGGRFNTADANSTVGGGYFNHATGISAIGGGGQNSASGGGAIGGGSINSATGYFGTVAGGYFNFATGGFPSIGGGYMNFASSLGAIGGGLYNGAGIRAAIGGGFANSASGYQSTIGGGGQNAATGNEATVPGGSRNRAEGAYSFAAGRRARANHAGSFVWGDSANADKTSSAADEYNVYASGGTRIFSSAGGATGVLLAPGGGSWSSVSDRNSKENLAPVEARTVLERLRALPISTWNFKAQDEAIRHMGPMAQDFHALFGLGPAQTTIDTIDADGVALAAIQGLAELVLEQREHIAALEGRLAALESERGARQRP